jgi:hypothetical protein
MVADNSRSLTGNKKEPHPLWDTSAVGSPDAKKDTGITDKVPVTKR